MAIVRSIDAGVQVIPWDQYYAHISRYDLLEWNPRTAQYFPAGCVPCMESAPDMAVVVLSAGPKRRPARRAPQLIWAQPDFNPDPNYDVLEMEYLASLAFGCDAA